MYFTCAYKLPLLLIVFVLYCKSKQVPPCICCLQITHHAHDSEDPHNAICFSYNMMPSPASRVRLDCSPSILQPRTPAQRHSKSLWTPVQFEF